MQPIRCGKSHAGNRHLTPHLGGYECDGCGAYFREFVITSRPGMTPYATETTMVAARQSARSARRIGLDGEICPR